jgi:hypothetical protein
MLSSRKFLTASGPLRAASATRDGHLNRPIRSRMRGIDGRIEGSAQPGRSAGLSTIS